MKKYKIDRDNKKLIPIGDDMQGFTSFQKEGEDVRYWLAIVPEEWDEYLDEAPMDEVVSIAINFANGIDNEPIYGYGGPKSKYPKLPTVFDETQKQTT